VCAVSSSFGRIGVLQDFIAVIRLYGCSWRVRVRWCVSQLLMSFTGCAAPLSEMDFVLRAPGALQAVACASTALVAPSVGHGPHVRSFGGHDFFTSAG